MTFLALSPAAFYNIHNKLIAKSREGMYMATAAKKELTYVLTNGYEITIPVSLEKLFDFMKWFQDEDSSNSYVLAEEKTEPVTLFKDTILSVSFN